jgi:RNA recognition motif-containing protein
MDEIIEFFDGYGKISEDKILIEENETGRRTGVGAIIFESEEFCQSAKEDKNRQEIGPHGRWVLLSDENDGNFKRAISGN